jgi:hypothetical protein
MVFASGRPSASSPQGKATKYTAVAMHGDETARRKHDEMGFQDGWGHRARSARRVHEERWHSSGLVWGGGRVGRWLRNGRHRLRDRQTPPALPIGSLRSSSGARAASTTSEPGFSTIAAGSSPAARIPSRATRYRRIGLGTSTAGGEPHARAILPHAILRAGAPDANAVRRLLGARAVHFHPGPRAKVHVQLGSSCPVTAGLQLRVPENATPGVRLALDRVGRDGHGKRIGTRDRGWRRLSATLAPRAQKQFLDLLPRPGLAAQEDEARAQAGIVGEATDRNSSSELFPAVASAQLFDHPLEGDSVERVSGVSPGSGWRFLPVVVARVFFVVRLWHAPSVPWPNRARRASTPPIPPEAARRRRPSHVRTTRPS